MTFTFRPVRGLYQLGLIVALWYHFGWVAALLGFLMSIDMKVQKGTFTTLFKELWTIARESAKMRRPRNIKKDSGTFYLP